MPNEKQEQLIPEGENSIVIESEKESTTDEKHHQSCDLMPLSSETARERVARMMNFFRDGSMVDLRSKLFNDDIPRDEIMAMWDEVFNTLDLPEELIIPEMEWKAKAGPKSGLKPWVEVSDDFAKYYVIRPDRADPELLSRAVDATMDTLKLSSYAGRLRRASIPEAVDKLPKTTNWGLPEAAPGREYKYDRDAEGKMTITIVKDRIPIYCDQAQAMENDLNHPGWAQGNMSFRRTDMKGPNVEDCSQRLIQGQPHSVTIIEATYAIPITKLIQKIQSPGLETMYSETALDSAIFKGLREAETKDMFFVGEDFDKWDKNVPGDLIDAGFDIIGRMFRTSENTASLLNCREFLKTSGLVTPEGNWCSRYGGVSSGSQFTLLLNCLMHVILIHYRSLRATDEPYEGAFVVKGDDGCSLFKDEDEIRAAEKVYAEEFNMLLNLEKQWIRKGSTSFCKKTYIHGDDHGTPPSYRTVASGLGYEKATPRGWTGWDSSLRWIAQLIPFTGTRIEEAIVRFFLKGDKYKLGFALPGGVEELIEQAGGAEEVARKLSLDAYVGASKGFDPREMKTLPIIKTIERIYLAEFIQS